jgi:hypothetical protein
MPLGVAGSFHFLQSVRNQGRDICNRSAAFVGTAAAGNGIAGIQCESSAHKTAVVPGYSVGILHKLPIHTAATVPADAGCILCSLLVYEASMHAADADDNLQQVPLHDASTVAANAVGTLH